MFYCDLTLPTPEANLACDEALLDLCEAGHSPGLLRFWEPSEYFVVVGYANHVATEVNLAFCRQQGIPVLRRCTGGGTVLQGPGVLNYSLVLPCDSPCPLQTITGANRFILERHRSALSAALSAPVEWHGQTDLAIGGRKFSGNAQRRKKKFLLFHGSFLLNFDLQLIQKTLTLPARQPEYRQGRSHLEFLMNLNQPAPLVRTALLQAWHATDILKDVPSDDIARLVRDKYSRDEWNLKF